MYKVYVLFSQQFERYYIWSTKNLEDRLSVHNKRKVKSTKKYVPWEVVHVEEYRIRQEAYKRELQLKSYKGGNAFKKIIGKKQ